MSLKERIKALVATGGPMPLGDFMALCLGDASEGYYTTGNPFGVSGDFITAPEISQMFGELIGLWAVDIWHQMGRPCPFRLVELGPGRGTLMADALRAAQILPDFLAAADLHLVETSPKLRKLQGETLAPFPLIAHWHDRISQVPEGPMIAIANEFFDALPIRQFEHDGSAFRERCIGLDSNGELMIGLGSGTLDDPDVATARAGDIRETGGPAEAIAALLAGRIMETGGALLAIDYGYVTPAFGDTFQAVRHHKPVDPLSEPGKADLTAHVNFRGLAQAARSTGAAVHGPVTQGDFLLSLGLLERAGRLGADKGPEAREAIRTAVQRLAGPEEMGTLFKALAITSPGLVPGGFRNEP